MRRIVALVSGFGWHVEDLARAARQRGGVELLPIRFNELEGLVGQSAVSTNAGGINLFEADGVLVRMMPPGSLEQVVFRMDALHGLEAAGVRVLNPPRAVEAAVDKYLATAKLARAGLPVPPTWCGESAEAALAAFDALGGDVVIKPLFGSEGRGMIRATDRETAWRVVHALQRVGSVSYLQQFQPHDGQDVRAFVLGDRVLTSMRRLAPPFSWRTNIAQGGRAQAITLDPESEQLALRAARCLGARMAGVDLLRGTDGRLFVLEVNAVPGWKALAAINGVDVAAEILADLLREEAST